MKTAIVVICSAILGLPVTPAHADVIARYEFTDWTFDATSTDANATASEYGFSSATNPTIKAIDGTDGNPGPGFYGQSWFVDPTYMHFSVTVDSGYVLRIDDLAFDSKRYTSYAPTAYDAYYSEDGVVFFSIGSGSLTGTTYEVITADNGGSPIPGLSGTIYFRIKGFNGTAEERWYQDNVTINGEIIATGGSGGTPVTIDWVTVGDPENACDSQSQGCFGAVTYTYRISRYEITNVQYAEFLNAVAATDTYGLYNTSMGLGFGGITRSGSSGSYSYSAIAGREDMPVNYVSFWDATRFANWLHNGQPTAAQNDTTTEDGAYTLTPTGITNNTITRNAGAEVFVTSEDEWYKAAYYSTSAMSYFDYPAGSDTQTTCALPGATANTANCNSVVADLTDVGSYTGSASPNGTFDQGGNLAEWNEWISSASGRGVRDGSFFYSPPYYLAASRRSSYSATTENGIVGFRVASPVPEAVPSLSPLGIALLGTMMGAAGIRRLRRA